MIINIETSCSRCSVALANKGEVLLNRYDDTPLNHAKALAPMVKECTDWLKRQDAHLDAVAVSIGPGSYTGLRIGLSLAKGLCVGYEIPLIGIPTLKLLASQAVFNREVQEAVCRDLEVYIVPMIDARRMEVYTATFDLALNEVQPSRALILEPNSFDNFRAEHPQAKIFIVGEGSAKYREVCATGGVQFLTQIRPDAASMMPLAEMAFRNGEFADVAYSTPLYIKDFQATTPKNKVLG